MTDTITLPREVAKRILRNIEIGNKLSASIEMRREIEAALDQPQDHPEHHLNMVPAGWKLVPVEPTEDMLAAVAWPGCAATDWEHMLAAAPQPPVVEQPQVAQEPVAWRLFDGDPFPGTATRHVYYDKDDFKEGVNPTEHFQLEPLYTHPQNLRCKSTQARLATLWGYEKPQPPRQPLTDAQINDHRLALPHDGEDLPDPWDFKQGVRAAERAHKIGGES